MTAQFHEKLIYNGEILSIAFCPPLPWHDPRLKKLDDDELEKDHRKYTHCTACWREYVGTWEIEDEKFYLLNVKGRYKIVGETPIFADWFNGVLRIPRGEELLYVHMGFGSVYEEEIHVKIENGVILKATVIDNRGKEHSEHRLAVRNLPGFENRFDGDSEL